MVFCLSLVFEEVVDKCIMYRYLVLNDEVLMSLCHTERELEWAFKFLWFYWSQALITLAWASVFT